MSYPKRAWAEIDLNAVARNYENYRRAVGEDTEIMCVVKADCYGHGAKAIALFLQNELGVKSFAVATSEEASQLRSYGITGDILILGYTPPEEADRLCSLDVIQTVTEAEYAKKLSQNLYGGRLRVHIALDTGMTRIGLHGSDIDGLVSQAEEIISTDGISAEGMFTHLAVADSADRNDILYTKAQIAKIKDVARRLEAKGKALEKIHYLNSAGGIYYKNDGGGSAYARLGIILYGLMPNSDLPVPIPLEPVMSLKAAVAQVKEIDEGEFVSYGRTFRADSKMKLATITIGYADGYPRLLSNRGEVLIHGRRARIVGRVCMDQLMCDASGIEVSAGDTVTLIGRDGDEAITADDLADIYGSIGYEVVCGISKRVPRVVFRDGVQAEVL